MPPSLFTDPDPGLDELYRDLHAHDLQPLWKLSGLLPKEPVPKAVPFRWKADRLRELAERSGKLVGVDRGGDRRVLACANPGLDGLPFATSTMWAGVQYLGAGELAPAHRHTPAALRFVLTGEGAVTLVDGDPIRMARGDLVLTPSMTFHEHHNPAGAPMMWLDVLDLPTVAALDAVFFEEGPDSAAHGPAGRSASERTWGGGAGLAPVGDTHDRPHSPLLAYRWADTERGLDYRSDSPDVTVRYTNPKTLGDVMPTMRCEIRRVGPGHETKSLRQTGSRVAAVLNGGGTAIIRDEEFALEPGDIFVVPSWAPYALRADERLDVFSTTDAPVLEALGLYRESPR